MGSEAMRLLAKMSLFGVLGGAVIGGVIFLAGYGMVIDPDAAVGTQAGDAVVTGAAAVRGERGGCPRAARAMSRRNCCGPRMAGNP